MNPLYLIAGILLCAAHPPLILVFAAVIGLNYGLCWAAERFVG